jgi:hypothetical protein
MISQSIMDDLNRDPPLSTFGTQWQLFTDRVMGGISHGTMVREIVADSLANNGASTFLLSCFQKCSNCPAQMAFFPEVGTSNSRFAGKFLQ